MKKCSKRLRLVRFSTLKPLSTLVGQIRIVKLVRLKKLVRNIPPASGLVRLVKLG